MSSSHSQGVVVAGASVAALAAVQLFTNADPLGRCVRFYRQLAAQVREEKETSKIAEARLLMNSLFIFCFPLFVSGNTHTQENKLSASSTVKKGIDDYSDLHRKKSVEERNDQYKELVNAYYDLATVFYEWGWGSCFHFSYEFPHESFYESIRRHEHQLASQLGVYGLDKHVLDVGCGIGGPMRNIAKFLQCKITGITLNPYQVNRGNELTQADKFVADKCKSVQGDFMEQPFKDQEFDGAYAIEATCHAPDRVKCYKEVYRLLKPGAHFALYEWCMTDKYVLGITCVGYTVCFCCTLSCPIVFSCACTVGMIRRMRNTNV